MSSTEIDDHIGKIYDVKRRLGKGAYGIVWKAINRETKDVVALKKIYDAFRNPTDAQRTYREVMFLREFGSHPNIVKLLGMHKASNNVDIYLVFEYMDTDLHNVIQKGDILQDVHKRYIMYQLIKATIYIHSGNVIHRDQKPSNILLDTRCRVKIADFGLARSLKSVNDDGDGFSDPSLTDYVATRWYRAPEILLASKRYTHGIDMWSLGCILAEMLLGKPLFPGTSTVNQMERILATIYPPTSDEITALFAGQAKWLLSCLPTRQRCPLSELLQGSPPDAIDLLSHLLVFNPHKRMKAAEALQHTYVERFAENKIVPLLNCDVLPPVRDDVQLPVEEYRNKLYKLVEVQDVEKRKRQESRRACRHLSIEDTGLHPKVGQRARTLPGKKPNTALLGVKRAPVQLAPVSKQEVYRGRAGDRRETNAPKLLTCRMGFL
ncbi:mitogen-activated protein kinase 15 isoform X2 [Anabrus simplex]|uniref:mitogen-activated protein kinase 15 isoform X2 n=1 Tax=Anabrus simplex TaxID=316456 RepID=UPI0035A3551E